MKLIAGLALTALLLAGCEHAVQTTSGADYLARYDAQGAAATGGASSSGKKAAGTPSTDELIRQAAAVEPILTFPARIGLARIENGALTTVPAGEGDLWLALAAKHAELGSFVAVDPLLAEYTARSLLPRDETRRRGDVGALVETIRLGAARQHLDAVLIYEVGARADSENTWLALADLTIIGGAILPTRSIKAEGRANALLLDVRNGYPYGRASVSADLSELSPSWGSDRRTGELREAATLKVAGKLVPEVEAMFAELVEKRRRP